MCLSVCLPVFVTCDDYGSKCKLKPYIWLTGEYDLMIANAQLEDDAEFQCQVMATEHTPPLTSRKATLTILGKFTHPSTDQS